MQKQAISCKQRKTNVPPEPPGVYLDMLSMHDTNRTENIRRIL